MSISNYNKFPVIEIENAGKCWTGWADILKEVTTSIASNGVLVIECYHGVNESEFMSALHSSFLPKNVFCVKETYKSEAEIDSMTFPDVTEDRIFGIMTRLKINDFIDPEKLEVLQQKLKCDSDGIKVIIGTGASQIFPDADVLLYADMARWEIQQRMRRAEVSNLGVSNYELEIARKYKRAYFVDWQICDRIKKETVTQWDYVLDTNKSQSPKMIATDTFYICLQQVVAQPFRVVPFFDPGPWGGQWMREVFDLDKEPVNFAWCFDCVPEENSILLKISETTLEFPSVNLVYFQPKKLLGEGVYSRFGDEFPIRFDFLDTIEGGNLSLQVHPMTEYIQENFGMNYTQDESYYMLDASEDATVYLGLKEDVDPEVMIKELKAAQNNGATFDAAKHVEQWPAKKHDHFLIPAGTVHCSGTGSMVLEISATPYIFTFKLWDWGRLGLDGLPRPINVERGEKSIQWDRKRDWVKDNLINRIELLEEGKGYRAEKTGLHETEFIETIRHWFTEKVVHDTEGNLNVLNLVEGREVVIESPTDRFKPYTIHYAETFIIPADVGEYSIRPLHDEECATIKAYVKY